MDSQNICFYDARTGKYTAYVRRNKIYTCPDDMVWYYGLLGKDRYGGKNKYARRTVARAESDTLAEFPMPEVVLEPDDEDPMFKGCRVMDFYCPPGGPVSIGSRCLLPLTPNTGHTCAHRRDCAKC